MNAKGLMRNKLCRLKVQNKRSYFVLSQGAKIANSGDYLKFLQRRQRAKEQVLMYRLFCIDH